MKEIFMRCETCLGRKNLYQINRFYSLIDTGGKLIKCPACSGTGKRTIDKSLTIDESNQAENIPGKDSEQEIIPAQTECAGRKRSAKKAGSSPPVLA